MKKGRNLLDKSRLLETHPDLHDVYYGMAAVYGNIIFAKRMEEGYTQRELSAKSEVSLKTITKAESGIGNTWIDNYEKIFNALSLNISDVAKLMVHFTDSEQGATGRI